MEESLENQGCLEEESAQSTVGKRRQCDVTGKGQTLGSDLDLDSSPVAWCKVKLFLHL